MKYHAIQLNVELKPSAQVDWKTIPGIDKVVQVFPGNPDLQYMYVVYAEDGKRDEVEKMLLANESVSSCEKIPVRGLVR